MITRLSLKNFTAFSDLSIAFSRKINVIIGENSTGKTQLLKAAYALCSGGPLAKKKSNTEKSELETSLTEKFLRLFMPLDEKLGKMRYHGVTENAQLDADFDPSGKVTATFHTNSKSVTLHNESEYTQYQAEPVFIPTKEVLSFMKGFNSLYEKYGLSFDQTYQDICLLLDLPEVRPETLHEKSKWAIETIEDICGGRFVFYGGGKVTFKTKNVEYSANSMAEGFRKAGILSRLLETGAIQPGKSGPLFWDEPESNLNPKLLKQLAQILIELSRNGQQIIIATHDYVLLKSFSLLINKEKDDHIKFHSLYRDEKTQEIKVASTEDYLEIAPNPIDDAFGDLINQEIKNEMGDLGK